MRIDDRHADVVGYYENFPNQTKTHVETGITLGDIDPTKLVVAEQYREYHFDDDLIPEVDPPSDRLPENYVQLDRILDSINLADVYRALCNKTAIKGNRTWELLSCPVPDHPDKDPSASFNWVKKDGDGLWKCHSSSCGAAGDKYDLAAYVYGYDVPDYRHTSDFHNVCKRLAAEFGWVEDNTNPKGESLFRKKEAPPWIEAHPQTGPEEALDLSTLDSTDPVDETAPSIPWREILPPGSFWHEYVTALEPTDIHTEFIVWTGAMLLSLCGGRNAYIPDTPDVYGNLFMLLLNDTATGKTRMLKVFESVGRGAMPLERSALYPRGVNWAGEPASGEALADGHCPELPKDTKDDDGEDVRYQRRVSCLWVMGELATYISKRARAGNTLTGYLLQLYDCPDEWTIRRAKSSNSTTAVAPYGCVISTSQPQVLSALLDDADVWSGQLNRWLPIVVFNPKPESPKRHQANLNVAVNLLRSLHEGVWRESTCITMTPEAEEIWIDFWRDTLLPLKHNDNDGMSRHVYGRIDLLMRKLMIVMCVNEKKREIDADLVARTKLFWPYLHASFKSLISDVSQGSERDQAWRWFDDQFEKAGGSMPMWKLNKKIGQKRGVPSRSDLESVRSELLRQRRMTASENDDGSITYYLT